MRVVRYYLKNARPKTDSDHVFVKQVPPYTNFNLGAVGALVRVHLQKSGIHLEGNKERFPYASSQPCKPSAGT